MNKIIFKKARAKNFLSYGNTWQEVEFPSGMNTIMGFNRDTGKSNGSGKSSLVEMVPFALFGKTIKDLPQAKVVNWSNRSGCVVELTLEMGGNEYVFHRGLKPNRFKVSMNGNDIVRPSDVKTFQWQMEQEVIGMDFKTFKNLIYFSPNNTISILGAKKDDKRKFLESLFDLSEYSDMLKLTNEKLKNLTKRIENNEYIIQHGNQDIVLLNREIEDTEPVELDKTLKYIKQLEMMLEVHDEIEHDTQGFDMLDELKTQLEELKKFRATKSEEKVEITTIMKGLRATIDAIDVSKPLEQKNDIENGILLLESKTKDIDIKEYQCQIDELIKDKEVLSTAWKEYDEERQGRDKESGIYTHTISQIKKVMQDLRLKDKLEGVEECPLCKSNVNHEYLTDWYKDAVKKEEEEMVQTITMRDKAIAERTTLQGKLADNEEKDKSITKEINTLQDAIDTNVKWTGKIEELKERLTLIPDTDAMMKDIEVKELEYDALQKQLDEIVWKLDMTDLDITTYTEKVADIETRMKKAKEHEDKVHDVRMTLKSENEHFEELTKISERQQEALAVKKAMITAKTEEIRLAEVANTSSNRMLDHLNYLRVSLKDENVKQFAISALLPFLNQRANYYLSESGFPYIVSIDGWLDVIIRGMGTEDVGYNSLSGGETKAMDMAIQLACNDIAELHARTTLGISIYDEILDTSLDADGVKKLVDVVAVKQRDTDNCVFVITHRDEIKEMDFDNNFMVVKENGFSTIQTETTMV